MRLQVFLSHNGVCSRRKAMDIIGEGRVFVNGKKITEPSHPVDDLRDKIMVDGQMVGRKDYAYVLLNKPKGYVTTRVSQKDQVDIFALLPQKFQHLAPVGRLDKDTEGLLLLTNDGEVAYALTHPKFDCEKKYFAKLRGELLLKDKKKVESGVYLDGKKTAPAKILFGKFVKGQTQVRIVLHEGRKRQVRRMFAKVGLKVMYLKRESQGPLKLGSLKLGTWRLLTKSEINLLKKVS